ncbi:MAG: hypothetical protein Q9193_001759 [Seirophora villosa]
MSLTEADYIIVGGGLTGCVIASRLSQNNPDLHILLLEAGVDAFDNPLTKQLQGAFALAGSDLDHDYKTKPQPNTNDRLHTITAGKVLGGGTILNYGGWARGDASDYDHWAKVVGDHRWSYEGQLPYMKRAEDHFMAKLDPEQRGSGGPIRITSMTESEPKHRLREPVKAAWEELDVHRNPRGDCGSLRGICELLQNWDQGQRQPANLVYNLRNVDTVTGAEVDKLGVTRVNGSRLRASSVILTDGRQFKARKEIVLTAGTIKTPQILMLSGIGPAHLLSRFDIPVLKDNPHVGKNYFDHFALFQTWKLRNQGSSDESQQGDESAYVKGLPCDWTVNEGTPPDLLLPALQADAANGKVDQQSLSDPSRTLVETMVMYSALGAPVPDGSSYVTTSTMLLLPTSRGSLEIVSSSPKDYPAIDPNYYDTEADRVALIHGVRRVTEALLKTSAAKSYVECEQAPPGTPALSGESSDADIDSRIRMAGVSHAHAAGTACMGKVVDSQLRVHGIAGLRIADASVLPVAIGGHPQATLYGLAEQAAELILHEK